MSGRRPWTMWGLLCLGLLAACVSTNRHPVPGGPPFDNGDLRFVAPTGWQMRPSTDRSPGLSRILVYLANQPLRDDCGEIGSEVTCRLPLADGLRPGGLIAIWAQRSCVAKTCDLPAATLISIGNRQGVRMPVTVGCEETGYTERSAYYVTVTPQRVDIILTCARNPTDATRSAFLGFLDAIHWRVP